MYSGETTRVEAAASSGFVLGPEVPEEGLHGRETGWWREVSGGVGRTDSGVVSEARSRRMAGPNSTSREEVLAKGESFGFARSCADSGGVTVWAGELDVGEHGFECELRASADRKVAQATQCGGLLTALNWWERFILAMPHRRAWLILGEWLASGMVVTAEVAAVYAEDSLRTFAEFIRVHGSVKKGKVGELVRGKGIGAIVSAIRLHKGLGDGHALLRCDEMYRLGRQLKQFRLEDGAAGSRDLRRALRGRHLRSAVDLGFERHTLFGVFRWAVLLCGHNILARGGELGTTDKGSWRVENGLAWEHIVWHSPDESNGYEALTVWLMSIKNIDGCKRRMPIPIRRRCMPGVPRGTDPLCAYDAILAWWEAAEHGVPAHERPTTPFFRLPDSERVIRTADVCEYVRSVVAVIGEDPMDFGAVSLRSGGASDIADVYGDEGKWLIDERGRWESDIADIYRRASAQRHLDVSARMADSDGVDLEQLYRGWSQPAFTHTTARSRGRNS